MGRRRHALLAAQCQQCRSEPRAVLHCGKGTATTPVLLVVQPGDRRVRSSTLPLRRLRRLLRARPPSGTGDSRTVARLVQQASRSLDPVCRSVCSWLSRRRTFSTTAGPRTTRASSRFLRNCCLHNTSRPPRSAQASSEAPQEEVPPRRSAERIEASAHVLAWSKRALKRRVSRPQVLVSEMSCCMARLSLRNRTRTGDTWPPSPIP